MRTPPKTVVVANKPTAQVKRELKEQKRAEKAEARALKRAARKKGAEAEEAPERTSTVPAPVRLSTPSRYGTPLDEPGLSRFGIEFVVLHPQLRALVVRTIDGRGAPR